LKTKRIKTRQLRRE